VLAVDGWARQAVLEATGQGLHEATGQSPNTAAAPAALPA
jgi:hypothetical protein